MSQPFPPDLHNIINHKQYELVSWNFERMSTPLNMSRVMCHVSCVTCHVSRIICHMSLFFSEKGVKFIGGGSVINGAYPASFSSYTTHTDVPSARMDLEVRWFWYNEMVLHCKSPVAQKSILIFNTRLSSAWAPPNTVRLFFGKMFF